MTNKTTKKEFYNILIATIDTITLPEDCSVTKEEITAFLKNELTLVTKKRSSKKEEAKKEARETKKATLLEALTNLNGERKTATELFVSVLPDESVQLVTSLLYTLIDEGAVKKVVEKGKSYFTVA